MSLLIVLTATAFCAHAESSVWKISRNGRHIFVGGTIHVLSNADYPLPIEFEDAFSKSAVVVFETDIQKLNSPKNQSVIMNKLTYKDHRNLKNVLSPEVFARLDTHLSARGIPIDGFLKFKPGLLSSTLTLIELQMLGFFGTGVDEFFFKAAQKNKTPMIFFETLMEQVDLLEALGKGQEDAFIDYTLKDIENLPTLLPALKEAWRQGNEQDTIQLMLVPLKTEFPQVYNALVVKRNNKWIPAIEDMFNTDATEFVLVGLLHIIGQDGILEHFKSRGYTIEKF